MKLDAQELKELTELLTHAEEFRPLVHAVMAAIDSYSEELKKYPRALALFSADITNEVFRRHLENGFSREGAMLLTINQQISVKEAMKDFKQKR